jgi:hypothetical protein
MTWTEMKQTFASEWLRITDFDLEQSGHLITGVVEKHSRNKEEVYQLPAVNQPTAFRYTGAIHFCGLERTC